MDRRGGGIPASVRPHRPLTDGIGIDFAILVRLAYPSSGRLDVGPVDRVFFDGGSSALASRQFFPALVSPLASHVFSALIANRAQTAVDSGPGRGRLGARGIEGSPAPLS